MYQTLFFFTFILAAVSRSDEVDIAHAQVLDRAREYVRSVTDKPQAVKFHGLFVSQPKPNAKLYVCGQVMIPDEDDAYVSFIYQDRTHRILFESFDDRQQMKFHLEWAVICDQSDYVPDKRLSP